MGMGGDNTVNYSYYIALGGGVEVTGSENLFIEDLNTVSDNINEYDVSIVDT
jgi:hypothetical protein